jgi:hypothetical protein
MTPQESLVFKDFEGVVIVVEMYNSVKCFCENVFASCVNAF